MTKLLQSWRVQNGRAWAVCRFCGLSKWIYEGDCGACRDCAKDR